MFGERDARVPRRRDRRKRQFPRHEQLSVKMHVAAAVHHSAQCGARVDAATQTMTYAAPALVVEYIFCAPAPAVVAARARTDEYVAPASAREGPYRWKCHVARHMEPASAVTFTALSPVIECVAPAPAVIHEEPAPVIEYVAPSPVIEYIAPPPAVIYSTPSLKSPPAYTMAAVTTDVNLDTTGLVNPHCPITAVEASTHRSLVQFLPWTSLLRPCTTKFVTNCSLPRRRPRT